MFPTHESVTNAPVPADVFSRKLARAIEQGVQLVATKEGTQLFATSMSRPGVIHPLNHAGCSCEDFFYSGSCVHHSLAVATLVFAVVADE